MSPAILITRPEPDASYFEQQLRHKNCKSVKCPLTEIIYADGNMISNDISKDISIEGSQIAIATSANALRGFLPRAIFKLPVFVVGAHTAEEARRAGFQEIITAQNDEASLRRLIIDQCRASSGSLLYLTGRHRAGNLPACLERRGFDVRIIELYEARALSSFPAPVIDMLRRAEIGLVSFFSARAAEIFASLIGRHNLLDCLHNVRAVCLSSSCARPLSGLGFCEVIIAPAPTLESISALIVLMMRDKINLGK